MKYLDPKNDFIFKKIFGEHKHICMSFLNSVLPLKEEEKIIELEYIQSEQVPEILQLKNSVVDVKCKDQTGRIFIVEMQMYWTTAFKQRVLFNASKAYVRQLKKSEHFKLLQPVYSLSLVNQNYSDSDNYYHHYTISEVDNQDEYLKGLEFVFIELPKFEAKNLKDKKLQILWLRFLTEIDDDTRNLDKAFTSTPEIKEAIEYLEESHFTEEELDSYDQYWDAIRTYKTLHAGMIEMGLKEGLRRGIEQGVKKGIEQGVKKGIEQGMEQGIRSEKVKIAKSLLAIGMSSEDISKATLLSIDEIESL